MLNRPGLSAINGKLCLPCIPASILQAIAGFVNRDEDNEKLLKSLYRLQIVDIALREGRQSDISNQGRGWENF